MPLAIVVEEGFDIKVNTIGVAITWVTIRASVYGVPHEQNHKVIIDYPTISPVPIQSKTNQQFESIMQVNKTRDLCTVHFTPNMI